MQQAILSTLSKSMNPCFIFIHGGFPRDQGPAFAEKPCPGLFGPENLERLHPDTYPVSDFFSVALFDCEDLSYTAVAKSKSLLSYCRHRQGLVKPWQENTLACYQPLDSRLQFYSRSCFKISTRSWTSKQGVSSRLCLPFSEFRGVGCYVSERAQHMPAC